MFLILYWMKWIGACIQDFNRTILILLFDESLVWNGTNNDENKLSKSNNKIKSCWLAANATPIAALINIATFIPLRKDHINSA